MHSIIIKDKEYFIEGSVGENTINEINNRDPEMRMPVEKTTFLRMFGALANLRNGNRSVKVCNPYALLNMGNHDLIDKSLRKMKKHQILWMWDGFGHTLLYKAVMSRSYYLAEKLVDMASNAFLASLYKKRTLVQYMIDYVSDETKGLFEKIVEKSNLDYSAENIPTALQMAIIWDNKIAIEILKKHTSKHVTDYNGNTVLMTAIMYNNNDIAMEVIDDFPDHMNQMGQSALNLAIIYRNKLMITKLMQRNAYISSIDSMYNTVLMTTIAFDLDDVARMYMHENLNAVNYKGQTALHVAIQHGNRQMMMELLERGAHTVVNGVNIKDTINSIKNDEDRFWFTERLYDHTWVPEWIVDCGI